MIVSRGISLLRLARNPILRNAILKSPQTLQPMRQGHDWSYRTGAHIPKRINIYADLVGAVMFWWILWHLYHEYGHITGEFDYPDPSQWTNAELGIPPDNYEE